jgi:hypothetical protein
MKTTLALFGALTLLVSNGLSAGTDYIIKQHAKDLANPNNAPTGMGRPAPQLPAPAPAAPAPPALTPSLVKFQTELGTLQAGSPASTEQQQKFTQELMAGAVNAKPSQAALAKLAKDLADAFAEKPLSAASRASFVQQLDAVMNPGKYPQAKLDGILGQMPSLFTKNGVSSVKATTIADDVKAISDEIQRGGVK